MNKQDVIKVLLEEARKHPELSDTTNTKIFLPNEFSIALEEEMRIRNIKDSGLGLYDVQYGPFEHLSALNRSKNYSVKVSVKGEIINVS